MCTGMLSLFFLFVKIFNIKLVSFEEAYLKINKNKINIPREEGSKKKQYGEIPKQILKIKCLVIDKEMTHLDKNIFIKMYFYHLQLTFLFLFK